MEGGYYVFVVSDATGATGEMVLRAALTQFDTSGVVVDSMAPNGQRLTQPPQ